MPSLAGVEAVHGEGVGKPSFLEQFPGDTPATPASLAKAALRRLAQARQEPTPENFRQAYEAEAQLAGAPQPAAEAEAKGQPSPEEPHSGHLSWAVMTFMAAAAVLFFAGPELSHVAGMLAERSGLGGTFVGTTLVAITTSLPELVSSITALRLGAIDLAIGNTFGSNAFNMILFVPLDAMHEGPLFAALAPVHAVTAMAVIVATAIAVLGQLYQAKRRVPFFEPDALLMIFVLVGALALVYQLS